jgi:hypothetical protein
MNASFWETSYPPGLKWDCDIPLMGARELLAVRRFISWAARSRIANSTI